MSGKELDLNGEATERDLWVKARFNDYIQQEGSTDAYLRGLHYFIVSTYGKEDAKRWLPTRKPSKKIIADYKKNGLNWTDYYKEITSGSWIRYYRNTKTEYKSLSTYLVDARIKGIIPFSLLQDHKNDEIDRGADERRDATIGSIYGTQGEEFYYDFTDRDSWEDFVESIEIDYSRPHFYSQDKRLVVIVEKSKAKSEIKYLAQSHGADFIQFGGQHSVTRLYQLAKMAKEEGKAMRLLHLTDLDVAGWFMPQSTLKRIQSIYPHPEHESIRVCLTRKQAEAWDLVESFEAIADKDYAKGLVDRFERESGSIKCIELDGVPKDLLVATVKAELGKHAGLDEDRKRFADFKKEKDEEFEPIIEKIKNEFYQKAEYDEAVRRYNYILEDIRDTIDVYQSEITELESTLADIQTDITEDVNKRFEEE